MFYKSGQIVEKEVLKEIKKSFIITKHAKNRLKERSCMIVEYYPGYIDYVSTKKIINEFIDNNILTYYNTDGSINIAINKYNYFVFVFSNNKWLMTTYKEKSWNNIDIFAKRELALTGKER